MRFQSVALSGALLAFTTAQKAPVPANFDLEFRLVQCSNLANVAIDPNSPNVTRTWSHIGLYSPNTPQKWQYAMPQDALPYVRWEGRNTSAYFWAEAPNPRGFLDVQIRAEAAAYKIGAESGKVIFEGEEFTCGKVFGEPSWGGACFDGDYEYCAGYTMCHDRFSCKKRDTPLPQDSDIKCPTRPTQYCYPYWNEEG